MGQYSYCGPAALALTRKLFLLQCCKVHEKISNFLFFYGAKFQNHSSKGFYSKGAGP
jgi:hypothetical protein